MLPVIRHSFSACTFVLSLFCLSPLPLNLPLVKFKLCLEMPNDISQTEEAHSSCIFRQTASCPNPFNVHLCSANLKQNNTQDISKSRKK